MTRYGYARVSTWEQNTDSGYVEALVTGRLSDLQITERLPTLPIRLGDPRPHMRGKIREYLPR